MATENKQLNVNPLDWDTADQTFVPDSGVIWYYYETSGSVFHVVGDGTSTVQELRDGNYIQQVDSLGLSSGRVAFQELTSDSLDTVGWYTVAELDDSTDVSGSTLFSVAISGRRETFSGKVQIGNSAVAKTSDNTDIEIIGSNDDSGLFTGFRVAKSDAVQAGAKIQIKIAITGINLITQISNNIGRVLGFELVTPYLDDTPTLPDGVTTGTFIEAGAELSFESAIFTFLPIQITRVSDDQLIVLVPWGETPKQGSSIDITLATSNNRIYDGAGNYTVLSTAATISNFYIEGKNVGFQINETDIGLNLNASLLSIRANGTGFKLTITD